jgi:hypothetical protein
VWEFSRLNLQYNVLSKRLVPSFRLHSNNHFKARFSRLMLDLLTHARFVDGSLIRRLLKLVNDKYVSGWDDPRLLTINGTFNESGSVLLCPAANLSLHRFLLLVTGLRRRGYTADGLNLFCDRVIITPASSANRAPSNRIFAASCFSRVSFACAQIGVSRNTNSIPDSVLETAGRDNLEPLAL